jgi:multisubunit Na+/H+ antiporter MnhB subunit
MNDIFVDIAIYVTYGLVAIALLGVVLFSAYHMVQDFSKTKGALVGIVVLAVILIISYFVSTNEPYEAFNVGPTASQWVGSGIISTMVLIGLGLLSAIFTEVYKFFR